MALPKVGNLAPAFKLFNHTGTAVNLKDFRGKKHVVLYFYPKASTPGCTTQACGLRDSKEAFESVDTVILGVSPDPAKRLVKFIDKYALNFDLLSDEDHKVAEKYGVWGPKQFMGRDYIGILRTSFLIDKEGRLRFIMDKVKTKTHDQDMLDYISVNL